jgi:lipopolysaccharide transport system permease protein
MSRSQQRLIIEFNRADTQYWRDLWRYRELFGVLAWRDLSVRYKETVFGVLWALARPFLTMLVFTVIFGRLAKLPSVGAVPYPLMVLIGMIIWTLFSTTWTEAGSSLIRDQSLITKVYFPRMIVPAASMAVNYVDFLVSFVILVALMFWYHVAPSWQIVLLPFLFALAFLANLGPGLWIAALNVRFRDFRYILPFIIQLGLYVSPVGFSSNIIPDEWRWLYSLNPVVGIIDGFRWCILGGQGGLYVPGLCWSVFATAFFLGFGIRQFRKVEKRFADLL